MIMKHILKISVMAAIIFCSTAILAQEQDPILQGINTALSQGNCEKAQKLYNAYKAGGKTSASIENRIKECKANSQVAEQKPVTQTTSQKGTSPVSIFPDEQKIKTLINNYYDAFKYRQYSKLDNYFAETVHTYFNKTNVKGSSIKDSQKNYHEKTLKTKEVSHFIYWDTFTVEKSSANVVSVSFILDYWLNTEKYGNQKYKLKIYMDINNNYRIINIQEKQLEKINL